jgi:hypothetical protein
VLEASDDTLSSGEYRDQFDVEVRAGQTVRVDLTSADFNTYLIVLPPGSDRMDNDDFGGTYLSRAVVTAGDDGLCRVVVTTYRVGEVGAYTLSAEMVPAEASERTQRTRRGWL